MQHKPAKTSVKIHDLIQTRWSPRAINPDKDISDEDLTALLEAARWAPSCFNDQPWRYIVCVKSKDETSWQHALNLSGRKKSKVGKKCARINAFHRNGKFQPQPKPNRWTMYDTGAASVSLCFQATALGLVVHQMGGFDAESA